MKQAKLYRKDYLVQLKKAPCDISLEALQDLVKKTKPVFIEHQSKAEQLIEYAPYVYYEIGNVGLGITIFEQAFATISNIDEASSLLLSFYNQTHQPKAEICALLPLIQAAAEKLTILIQANVKGNTELLDSNWRGYFRARNLHRCGYESLAFQLFELSLESLYASENFREICEWLEEGLVLSQADHKLIWHKHKREFPVLLERAQSMLEELYHRKKKALLESKELCSSALLFAKIGWKKFAKKIFPEAILCELNELKYMGEAWSFVFDVILDSIRIIADEQFLSDKSWALEIFLDLMVLDCSIGNNFYLLSNMSILGDIESEKRLFEAFKRERPNLKNKSTYLVASAIGFSDSKEKPGYLSTAIEASKDARELFILSEYIKSLGKYHDLAKKALAKARDLTEYYFVVFDLYCERLNNQTATKAHLDFLLQEIDTLEGIDETNDKGESLLIRACQKGTCEVIRKLISLGADKTLSTPQGLNPLIASVSNLDEKFEYVEKDIIFDLINSGVDIHAVYKGQTAFTEAACDGYLDVLQVLLKKGASFEVDGDKGKTALRAAIYWMRMEVLSFLLEIGADASKIEGQIYTSYSSHFQPDADFRYMVDFLNEAGAKIPMT